MTIVYLKPCGLNLSHIHPRASTISFVAKDTIRTGSWSENTGQFHAVTLNEGQGTAFSPDALHFEQNIGCEDAILVAAFGSADSGTAQITEGMKVLPLDILIATFGGGKESDVDQIRKKFPSTPAQGIASCYEKCKIKQNQK